MKNNNTIIYTRVSSKEQERDGFSIPAQIKLLKKYAEDNNFHVVKIYEESESAKGSGRKQFNEMLDYIIANPEIKYLLCEKTDRLSRNFKDIATLDQLINENDLTIILVKENSELSKHSRSHEKFMFGIKALMAKNYVDNLSEEVKKGMNEKASQGIFPGGSIPLGYLIDKNTKKIYVDSSRSHLIIEMFQMYAEKKASLSIISVWSKTKSLKMPRSGRSVSKSQVERILKNPFYYGEFRWAGKIFKGSHEPIISKSLFDSVQNAFKSHNKPHLNRKSFAFGSLIVCSECGCKITAQIKKGKYVYYHCTGMREKHSKCYVPEKNIVQQFRNGLLPISINQKSAIKILEKFKEQEDIIYSNQSKDKHRIEQRLAQLQKWSEQSYIDKLEEKITESHWQNITAKWGDETATLQNSMAVNGSPIHKIKTVEKILELLQVLPSLWDTRNLTDKRKMVDLLYSNFVLDGATLYPTYNKAFTIIAEGLVFNNKRGCWDEYRTIIIDNINENVKI